ncbi:YpiB family protein [Staphylococcus americanisciuri]|uniref:YpiB family protein n=1 Tax=Staphylococcus americanisciuri TaxID=2973940 RepID=A0ABT2EYZ9_9STAP|nr:YpiB family protein [Staphylococcus americanisciuri]MCS4485454.1 YpiB family protein [Staphylococcus americanisciuri]
MNNMFETSLQQLKQQLIAYLLTTYTFKSRISVWLLNYIKADMQLLNKIHFVDHIIEQHPTLILTAHTSKQHAIQFINNERTLINSDQIFQDVIHTTQTIDIKLQLFDDKRRDPLLDQIVLCQLLDKTDPSEYLQDLYYLSLSQETEQQLLDMLSSQIDMSLMMHDADTFYRCSRLRNTLKLRKRHL